MNQRLNLILYSYLIFPAALIAVSLNYGLGLNWNEQLPAVPEYWPAFNFIFNTPHVVASSLLIFGKDSWKEYKYKFIIAFGLLSFITYFFFYRIRWEYFLAIYSFFTLKHVILQQFNLTHLYGVKKNWLSSCWKILGLIIAMIIYWKVYKIDGFVLEDINQILLILIIGFSFLSSFMYAIYRQNEGRRMIIANGLMVILSYIAFVMDGEFFSVLCIRAVHDMTGFVHYVDVFKMRREKGVASSWYLTIYRFLKSDWGSTLIVPIGIVFLILTLIPHGPERMSLLMVLSLVHYYTESFTWKSDSPYRKYLN